MSYCLYCHQSYTERWSWTDLFGLSIRTLLCLDCEDILELVKGDICSICGRSFSLFPEQYRQGDCCNDCIRWEENEDWTGILQQNRSLYVYNDFLKEVIAKFKYRGNAELIKAFYPVLKKQYKKISQQAFIIPIPLSEERNYERGFNQAELLARGISNHIALLLERKTHEEKQSKKTRDERLEQKENPFIVIEPNKVQGQKVLLVDDVYTTGSTLRYAAKVLLEAGAKQVSSITLAR
ncbi:ComF family protein [Fictibacillus barbaricus]|uniref:ComF family protein n=1 Tax=Fictibacillus barbaricus TaxID=182136 RepID=A0ABS2ZHG3_9BACL|nr:ComF family protein [Fictibacillus barbaricus]MBN3546763.1 ComF family protein [Fictibacillus barbaricus]GGB43645.1 amidophosphoribosyltransferase [Fictibacillus barbaricus]